MKLFKNVDIKDLKSIVANGILPISATGNNNWKDGNRANNSTEVVYLFDTTSVSNSFVKYGAALIEVEVEDAIISEIENNDVNKELYNEYTVKKVEVANIKKIYIPSIFKDYIDNALIGGIEISWCGISAKMYDDDYNCVDAYSIVLAQFAKTAPIGDANDYNYFRGVNTNRHMIDLYDVRYIF